MITRATNQNQFSDNPLQSEYLESPQLRANFRGSAERASSHRGEREHPGDAPESDYGETRAGDGFDCTVDHDGECSDKTDRVWRADAGEHIPRFSLAQ